MKVYLVFLMLLMFIPFNCFADLFEYTDNDGVVHFTDDPSKVPTAIRNSNKAKKTPSLTSEESRTVDVMMKLDNKQGQDIPVKDLPTFKKNVKKFGEAFKDELGDPAEPKDSRLTSPEGAWNLFLEGLRKGNLTDIKSSLIGKRWENGGYSELNKEQMAAFGKELLKLKVIDKKQDENSAVFNVRSSKTGINDTIRFIKFYDNWKIYEF
jgi:hypothetical protein